MTDQVSYELRDRIATLTLRNGKVNAFTLEMIAGVNDALTRAEREAAVVVITGQPGVLSAGMDLKFLMASPQNIPVLAGACGAMLRRLLAHPQPVVVACPGNAVAGGAFMLLAADYRLGIEGPFAIGTNEVKIGITMPHSCLVMASDRLTKVAFQRSMLTAELFDPRGAKEVGYLDEVVAHEALEEAARKVAGRLAALNLKAYAQTKARMRRPLLEAFDKAAEADSKSSFFA
jgi:enoyl-CoA hydratase